MTYYVRAYKGAKTINLQVEEKHQYYHSVSGGANYSISLPKGVTGAGTKATSHNIQAIFNTNSIKFTEGTGNDEMIGSKVHIKSANYNGWISLYQPTYVTDLISENNEARFNFRLMIVKFDAEIPHANDSQIADWFNNNYIYYSDTNQANSTNIKKLRESTKDTGKFKILHDESFTLTSKHTAQLINFTIPGFFGTANTKQSGDDIGTITNEDMRDIVCFLIGPINYYIDVDTFNTGAWMEFEGTKQLALGNGNMKISYYDI